MNRDALRVAAHNGCVQPVRGTYGALRVTSRSRRRLALRPRALVGTILLVGGGVAAYFLLAEVLAPRPSLRILTPEPDAVVSLGRVTVAVAVTNVELGASGRGYHLHYYLDAVLPAAPEQAAIPATGGWASASSTSHEWELTRAGLHILAVQLVTGDDRPLHPPVAAAVAIQVPRQASDSSLSTPSAPPVARPEAGC